MRKYNVLGGGQVEATTDLGLIEALRAYSQEWIPSVSIEDFMEGMAARAKIQTGDIIRTDYFVNFTNDLKQYGFVTPVTE
jgi:hypothetical protein